MDGLSMENKGILNVVYYFVIIIKKDSISHFILSILKYSANNKYRNT